MTDMLKEKQDYKKTELAWIPEDWEIANLKELTSVITKGTTPTTYGYNYSDSGVNFL